MYQQISTVECLKARNVRTVCGCSAHYWSIVIQECIVLDSWSSIPLEISQSCGTSTSFVLTAPLWKDYDVGLPVFRKSQNAQKCYLHVGSFGEQQGKNRHKSRHTDTLTDKRGARQQRKFPAALNMQDICSAPLENSEQSICSSVMDKGCYLSHVIKRGRPWA